jgi:hypothetical protein
MAEKKNGKTKLVEVKAEEKPPARRILTDKLAEVEPKLRDALVSIARHEVGGRTLIQAAADLVIDLRLCFERNGVPDYAGRSNDYREAFRKLRVEAMREAGFSWSKGKPEEASPTDPEAEAVMVAVTKRIDYAVSVRLRERFKPAELKVAGLDPKSEKEKARERERKTRERKAAKQTSEAEEAEASDSVAQNKPDALDWAGSRTVVWSAELERLLVEGKVPVVGPDKLRTYITTSIKHIRAASAKLDERFPLPKRIEKDTGKAQSA